MARLDDIRRNAEQLDRTGGAPGHPEVLELLAVIEAVKARAEHETADPWDEHTEALAWEVLHKIAPLTQDTGP